MTELAERTNVATQAQGRLIERWKTKENLVALQASYAAEVQELEAELWTIRVARMLETAERAQLDVIGKLVGEPRNGRTDSLYRLWIRVRIAINGSNGEPEDIIGNLDLATSTDFHFRELGYAAFRIDFDDKWDQFVAELAKIVDKSRAGGVSATIVWPTALNGKAGALTAKAYGSSNTPALALSSVATDTGGLASYRWRELLPVTTPILSSEDPFGGGGSGMLGFGSIDEGSIGES
jgi:hypothetical protein